MLRVQDAGAQWAAQAGVLMLHTVLTEQAGVVPLAAGPRSTLHTHPAVLQGEPGRRRA